MSHYMEFDPYLIMERNEQIREEVHLLRLKKQLRKSHYLHGLLIAALGEWDRILIGRAKLTQDQSPHSGASRDPRPHPGRKVADHGSWRG